MTLEHDSGCPNDTECTGCESENQARALSSAVRAIAHGGVDGPAGIEALTMAIVGSGGGFDHNLSSAVENSGDIVADALNAVADALNNIATAIQGRAS